MKKLLLIALILTLTTTSYAADPIRTTAKTTSVDLYPDGAKLYMRSSVNVKKGDNRIEIINLPQRAYNNTLRVGVSGGGVAIYSSQIEYDPTTQTPDEKSLKFDAQLSGLREESDLNALKIKTIDEQLALLKKQCAVSDAAKPNVDYVTSIVAVLGEKMNQLQIARYELSAKIEANNTKCAKIEQQKREYLACRQSLSNMMSIVMESDADKTVNIETEFVVSQAGWSPYYEVQINGDKCEVVTKATVNQSTGLDWSAVQLTLLSSNLSVNSTALPTVNSRYISVVKYVALSQKSYASSVVQFDMMSTQEETQEYECDVSSQFEQAEPMAMSEKSYNMQNFKLAVPYTVASGGSADLKFTSHSVPFTMQYLVMPTVSKETYLVANLTTPDILGRSSANIYLDGTFIGTQSLAAYKMADDGNGVVIELSLGADKDVIFNAVTTNFTKGNLNSVARETKVINNKNRSVNVKIVDQYPISTQSVLKVEDLIIDEGYTDGNSKGVVNWLVEIAPQKSATRSISYKIRDNRK